MHVAYITCSHICSAYQAVLVVLLSASKSLLYSLIACSLFIIYYGVHDFLGVTLTAMNI
jgi:hypothetical protein